MEYLPCHVFSVSILLFSMSTSRAFPFSSLFIGPLTNRSKGRVDPPPDWSHVQETDRSLRVALNITERTYNFSHLCSGHVIRFRGKRLNVDHLTFTLSEAMAISEFLDDDTLSGRMRVWAYVCEMEVLDKLRKNKKVVVNVEEDDKFESDIIASPEQMLLLYEAHFEKEIVSGSHERRRRAVGLIPDYKQGHVRVKRKMLDLYIRQWTNVIPWTYASHYYLGEKRMIEAAINSWERQTCLDFQQHRSFPQIPHIQIIRRGGCFAQVGKQHSRNIVSIGSGCFVSGKIMHEIAHALGMWHEQSRPDRNYFVNIEWVNIQTNRRFNFGRRPWLYTNTMDVPYDFASVMHYGFNYFSKNFGAATIRSFNKAFTKTMGQRNGASFFDVKAINNMYCSRSCGGSSLAWSRCYHDGYRNPRSCNQCICSTGLAPPFCKSPERNKGCSGSNELQATARPQTIATRLFPRVTFQGLSCQWKITVPRKWRIVLQFHRSSLLLCSHPCRDYVEVRDEYLGRTFPKMCCVDMTAKTFKSSGTQMLVIVKTYTSAGSGIHITYSRVSCGGCQGINYQLPCTSEEEKYITRAVWAVCYQPLPKPRKGYYHTFCKRNKTIQYYSTRRYCCPPYRFSRNNRYCVVTPGG